MRVDIDRNSREHDAPVTTHAVHPILLAGLIETPDRVTDFQRSAVDRFVEVPEISAESLIDLLRPIHQQSPVTALVCFLEAAILAAAVAADALQHFVEPG